MFITLDVCYYSNEATQACLGTKGTLGGLDTASLLGQTPIQSLQIGGRILVNLSTDGFVRLVNDAVLSILAARKVMHGERPRCRPSNFAFNAQQVFASFNAHVAHFTPVLSPRVADNPVLFAALSIRAPTNNRHNVVGALAVRVISEDAATVCNNRLSVNGGCHWTTNICKGAKEKKSKEVRITIGIELLFAHTVEFS